MALMEFKHSRGEQQRLREIDQKLKYLETYDDENVGLTYFNISVFGIYKMYVASSIIS